MKPGGYKIVDSRSGGLMVETHVIIIISVISFMGAWFGSLAGGGGLLILPVLLAFGLPVPVALGTRRFSTI